MLTTFQQKVRHKLIFVSCRKIGLEYIAGHLLAPCNLSVETVVVDLGGNLGNFSSAIAGRFGCACYCIEPDPELFKKIEENNNIRKYNVAVTESDGEREFILSNNNEANSFNIAIASKWGEKKVISVQTRSLQSLMNELAIKHIDLLKVDIEGAEIPLLKSLNDEELQKLPQITVEFHEFIDVSLEKETVEVISRLKKLGFRLVIFSPCAFSDVLFLNKKYIKLSWWQYGWYWLHSLVRYRGNNYRIKVQCSTNK